MDRPVRIAHFHSTFSLGGKEARAVRLMNAFGAAAEHVVVTATGELSARDAIDRHIRVSFPDDAPSLTGKPGLPRLYRLSRYLARFDLALTYNWGAFDAVMARHLFGGAPLIHHEDGFNEDEAARLKSRRNLYRRLGLSAAWRLVVPSRGLQTIARQAWGQPQRKIELIPNGIAVERYRKRGAADPLPGPARSNGEIIIGTLAGLRPVKNLRRLVRAFAGMQMKNSRLVIIGEGPECEPIVAEAGRCGVADRVHLPGFIADPWRFIGGFDIFALSSDSEQFPISLLEAMAASLPAVSTAVGDIPFMVSQDNRPLLVERADEAGFSAALDSLAERPGLRRALGEANRQKAAAEFDEVRMIERYARLYGETIGRPGAFVGRP